MIIRRIGKIFEEEERKKKRISIFCNVLGFILMMIILLLLLLLVGVGVKGLNFYFSLSCMQIYFLIIYSYFAIIIGT